MGFCIFFTNYKFNLSIYIKFYGSAWRPLANASRNTHIIPWFYSTAIPYYINITRHTTCMIYFLKILISNNHVPSSDIFITTTHKNVKFNRHNYPGFNWSIYELVRIENTALRNCYQTCNFKVTRGQTAVSWFKNNSRIFFQVKYTKEKLLLFIKRQVRLTKDENF